MHTVCAYLIVWKPTLVRSELPLSDLSYKCKVVTFSVFIYRHFLKRLYKKLCLLEFLSSAKWTSCSFVNIEITHSFQRLVWRYRDYFYFSCHTVFTCFCDEYLVDWLILIDPASPPFETFFLLLRQLVLAVYSWWQFFVLTFGVFLCIYLFTSQTFL